MRQFAIILLMLSCLPLAAQTDRAEVRKGNRQFRKENWREADISYRKALLKDSTSLAANYNLANTLYREKDYQGAPACLEKVKDTAPGTAFGADYFFNLGDAALQQKDYKGAVEAFLQSLILNPDDLEAKENYIYAKKMLENQPQDDQNQDEDDQQQEQKEDQNQDQNQEQQEQKDDPKPKEQPREEISPQQADQILQAIQAKEKETQEKVNKEKAEQMKGRQKEKNW